MKKLIVANWKMNPKSVAEAKRLFAAVSKTARRLKNAEAVICPPFPYFSKLQAPSSKVSLGGQDVFWEQSGAYTGEVSPKMLKELGVRYVIIGHSERRRHFGETDEMINKKVKAALAVGLAVILCVGETLEQRKAGQTKQVLRRQLHRALVGIRSLVIGHGSLVVAYEPVWAIGSGMPETPQNANTAAALIWKILGASPRVLYGGSVNAQNIGKYLAMPQISGALVGGASLSSQEFGRILMIAEHV